MGSHRRLMSLGTLGLVIALGSGTIPASSFQAPAQLDGRDWQKFGPREKEAYLAGFIAGAATVHGSAGAVSTDTVPSKAIDAMRAAKELPFPYSVSVYASQIDDYYWYQDHLDGPNRRCIGENQFAAAITMIRVALVAHSRSHGGGNRNSGEENSYVGAVPISSRSRDSLALEFVRGPCLSFFTSIGECKHEENCNRHMCTCDGGGDCQRAGAHDADEQRLGVFVLG